MPDGGAGDDVIQVTHGSIAAGGEGADTYQLDLDTSDGAPAIITDFNADEDVIQLVVLETDAADIGELTGEVWDDGTGIDLNLGETLMANVAGGQDIDPSAPTVYVNATGDAVQETSDDGAVIRAWGADQTIVGGAGDDSISSWIVPGDTGADAFFGEDGDDFLSATGAGNSTYVLEGEDVAFNEMATLDGRAGNDTLSGTDTVVMTVGEGADAFRVSQQNYYGNVVEPTVITDFVQGEDVIYVDHRYLDPYSDGSEAELEIVVWDDRTGADIVVGDQVVAKVTGGQDLTPDDVVTG